MVAGKQKQWNQRYQEKSVADQQPAQVLLFNQQLLKSSKIMKHQPTALDLACGLGANAIYLAGLGYQVTAMDYSDVALNKLSAFSDANNLAIKTSQVDFDKDGLPAEQYDLVVVSYYLQRELFPQIFSAIKKGGLLFYQTFSGESTEFSSGPANPAFRLKTGELLSLCEKQRICFYREDPECCDADDCYHQEAMIVAVRD